MATKLINNTGKKLKYASNVFAWMLCIGNFFVVNGNPVNEKDKTMNEILEKLPKDETGEIDPRNLNEEQLDLLHQALGKNFFHKDGTVNIIETLSSEDDIIRNLSALPEPFKPTTLESLKKLNANKFSDYGKVVLYTFLYRYNVPGNLNKINELYQNTESASIRHLCFQVLCVAQEEKYTETILDYLSRPNLRISASFLDLGRWGQPRIISELKALLEKTKNNYVLNITLAIAGDPTRFEKSKEFQDSGDDEKKLIGELMAITLDDLKIEQRNEIIDRISQRCLTQKDVKLRRTLTYVSYISDELKINELLNLISAIKSNQKFIDSARLRYSVYCQFNELINAAMGFTDHNAVILKICEDIDIASFDYNKLRCIKEKLNKNYLLVSKEETISRNIDFLEKLKHVPNFIFKGN